MGAAAAVWAAGNGRKRSLDGAAPSNGNGQRKEKKQKHKGGNGAASRSGHDGKRVPFRTDAEKAWLASLNRCYHCCVVGHSSPDCQKEERSAQGFHAC
jgi:hypothetical protein